MKDWADTDHHPLQSIPCQLDLSGPSECGPIRCSVPRELIWGLVRAMPNRVKSAARSVLADPHVQTPTQDSQGVIMHRLWRWGGLSRYHISPSDAALATDILRIGPCNVPGSSFIPALSPARIREFTNIHIHVHRISMLVPLAMITCNTTLPPRCSPDEQVPP